MGEPVRRPASCREQRLEGHLVQALGSAIADDRERAELEPHAPAATRSYASRAASNIRAHVSVGSAPTKTGRWICPE